ncbi:MAG: hypothetical protein J2P25_08020 [Nocardiopsaceae bacterium]|nr:hypothetical protein [Nocardiopsaceae bacterium]
MKMSFTASTFLIATGGLIASAGLCGLAATPATAAIPGATAQAVRPAHSGGSGDPSGIGIRRGGPKVRMDPVLFAKALKSPDWVTTPDGLEYRTCVHHVPRGGKLDPVHDTIIEPNGTARSFAPCPYPRLIAHRQSRVGAEFPGSRVPGSRAPGSRAPRPVTAPLPTKGWLEGSWWTEPAGDWADGLTAQYTVPTAPAVKPGDDGVDYLFSSLEDSRTASIIQPVIGYGPSAGVHAGDFLWEASYYVWGSNNAATGRLRKISPGDTIDGIMIARGCDNSGASCTWRIITDDASNGRESSLTVQGPAQPETNAQGGVFESYGAASCDQLFGNGQASFRDIAVDNGNSGQATPEFQPQTWERECGMTTQVTPTSTDITWNP